MPCLKPPLLLCTLSLCLALACTDDLDNDASAPPLDMMANVPDAALPATGDMSTTSLPDMATTPPPVAKDMDQDAKVDASSPSPDAATSPQDMTQEPDQSAADMLPPATRGSKGCKDAPKLTEGEHTFMLDGLKRKFILRLPKTYSHQRDWPLVFALHGNNGNTGYWDGNDPTRRLRKELEGEAILIVTEAIDRQWRDYKADKSTWNKRLEQELLYFDRMIERAKNELCVNTDAIFSMGFSGGGSFSGVLGCRRQDIRAIAAGGSVIYFDPKDCVGTPAAWITIGEQEQNEGRTAFKDFFRQRAGCAASSMPAMPKGCIAYDSCDAGTPVHYCLHPDAHIWPKFGVGPAWTFFKQFVKP